ncbi:MAG: glycosyltransferase [Firmicutes bacterium]|jgi:glycosyltransferase involved in cell wall biosynthesis|nr:glycosyltransferase [Bacillota bacterium]MDH7494405.1 glycosyltransferase [Bacillota bacterium]
MARQTRDDSLSKRKNRGLSADPVVSVIVPTYNREAILEKCLRGLLAQTFPAGLYEVIVIDDGSTDGTREMVKDLIRQWNARAPETRGGGTARESSDVPPCPLVYRYRSHTCAAAARNEGIKVARGALLIFLDSDIVTRAGFVEAHVNEHVSEAVREGGCLQSESAKVWHDGGDLAIVLDNSRVIVHGRVIYTTNLDDPTTEPRKITDISTAFFASGNVSIARRWVVEAGLFDEDFTEYGWEDLELGKRLKKLGLRVVRSEAPAGYHLKREFGIEDLPAIRRREIERGHMAMVYVRKHPTFSVRMTTMTVAPFIWIVSILGMGGWPDRPGAVRVLERLRRRGSRALLAVVLQIMVYYWYVQGIREASAHPRQRGRSGGHP